MADVNARTDRGQMIIITALVIAILFVALALVLNSAIYTENLSTRETGEQSSAVLQERHTVEQDLQLQIDRSNEHVLVGERDYPGASESFQGTVLAYGESRSNEIALSGRILVVQRNDQTEGTQIRQQTEGNFTAGGDIESQADWTLAENTTEAGNFEMEVRRDSILNISDGLVSDGDLEHLLDAAFHVKISNDTDEWRVFVFQKASGNISVVTQKGDRESLLDEPLDAIVDDRCSVVSDRAKIDLVEGTLAGEDCDQLEFYQSEVVGDEHDIEYRNARSDLAEIELDLDLLDEPYVDSPTEDDRVAGTYDIVVDRPVDNLDDDPYYDSGVGNPSSQSVLYDTSFTVVYRNAGAELVVENHDIEWTKVEP